MAEIRWTIEAETWLKDIYDYVAQGNPRAADRAMVHAIQDFVQLKEERR